MTVKQLRQGLKKYLPDALVYQGGVEIKAMRIDSVKIENGHMKCTVRLIRKDEKRA